MKRPIIGISSSHKPHQGMNGEFTIDRSYIEAVYRNGGMPQHIPIVPIEEIPVLLHWYDGILMSGGGGLLPHVAKMDTLPGLREQSPVRYAFEVQLITEAVKRNIPILGICRGHQMINEAFGGTTVNIPKPTKHSQKTEANKASHTIHMDPDTILSDWMKSAKVEVNSFHSQAIETVGRNLKVAAYSDDKVIEAIESTTSAYIMGLQFHPEFMLDNEKMMTIYKQFITIASGFKAQKIHA